MGGRGGGSGRGGGNGSGVKKIERTPFTNQGGGTYELDIPGLGGGFIASGPDAWGMEIAEAKVWNAEYDVIAQGKYTTINAAKQFIKEILIKNIKG